jgi:uncharacterized membrane protein
MFLGALVVGLIAFFLFKVGAMSVWVGVLSTLFKLALLVCVVLLIMLVLQRSSTGNKEDESKTT